MRPSLGWYTQPEAPTGGPGLDALLALDRQLFALLNGAGAPGWVDAFFVFITRDEGLRLPLVALWLLLLLACGPRWRRRVLWLVPLIAVSDGLTSQVLKELAARPRPCHEELAGLRLLVDCGPGFSFPSAHAANMGAAGLFLMRGVRRWRWRLAVLALPVLVATSRVHVGVHWPLDVIGGFAEGALLALAAEAGLRRLPWRRLRLEPPPARGAADPPERPAA